MGGLGGDNMSIIIICLLHGKPWEHLVERCKKIHADKKASTKMSEPAFSLFDRFTADGPFAEVSVLKASDDVHNTGDSTSSSSHTSSPSSSPISTDEKFETLSAEAAVDTSKTQEKKQSQAEDVPSVVVTQAEPSETKTTSDLDETKSSKSDDEAVVPAIVDCPQDSIVSNGD